MGLLPMDLSGSASQVAEKWWKWKRSFEYYAQGKGIDNARQKTSQFLHFAGIEVHNIFKDLQDPGPIPETDNNAFKIAIHKLYSYFHMEGKIPYKRYVFCLLAPKEEQTTDPLMVQLRKLAPHCDFEMCLNDNLRDQLIEKLTDFELKRKLLKQRNITLEEELDKACAWEAASRQASNMKTNPPLVERESDVVRGRANNQQRNSGGRPRHTANFVGNQEESERNGDCAFAFIVSEMNEDVHPTIICDEP